MKLNNNSSSKYFLFNCLSKHLIHAVSSRIMEENHLWPINVYRLYLPRWEHQLSLGMLQLTRQLEVWIARFQFSLEIGDRINVSCIDIEGRFQTSCIMMVSAMEFNECIRVLCQPHTHRNKWKQNTCLY